MTDILKYYVIKVYDVKNDYIINYKIQRNY